MKKRILLVEDEPIICETLTDLFQSIGYTTKSVPNGQIALNTLKLYWPHLIVSDIMMPEMGGIEFLGKVKSDYDWNDVPVVLLTAKREFEDRIVGLNTGADAYIAKPFDFQELSLVVQNLLALKENVINSSFQHSEQVNEVSNENLFVKKISQYMEDVYTQKDLSLSHFAEHFNLSPSGFKKKLKRIIGKSVQDYIREFRLYKSTQLLTRQNHNISEVAFLVGFKSVSHFSDAFRKYFGISPSDFLVKGEIF